MKIIRGMSFILLVFICGCQFLQEIYEPKDLLFLIKTQKDYLPPSVSVTEPTNGQEVGSTYQVTGTAVDNGGKSELAGINIVNISIDGRAFIGYGVYSGGWQAVFSNCTEGRHTNAYFAVDKNGNVSETNRFFVFVQTAMPSLTVSTPPYAILTNNQSILFSGSANVGKPYNIEMVLMESFDHSEKNEVVYSQKTGFWQWQKNIKSGTNDLYILAIASSGKTNRVRWIIVLDDKAPTVTVCSPANGAEVGTEYTLSGNITDNLSGVTGVWLQIDTNMLKPLTLSNGAFATLITLSQIYGMHTNRIIVRDAAGNCVTNIVFVERKAIPAITCNYPYGFAFPTSSITLSGKAMIESPYIINILKVKTNNVVFYMAESFPNSNWSTSFTLAQASNFIVIRADGNNGAFYELTNLIYYDNIKPTISVKSLPAITNVQTVNVQGTASDNLRVSKVYLKSGGSLFALASGTTNWMTNTLLNYGLNTILVFTVDTAGNVSTTNTFQITYYPPLTVTFNSAGGSAVASTNVNTNMLIKSQTTTRTGYSFCGWYTNTNFAAVWNFASNRVIGKITLYAKWLANGNYIDNGTTVTITNYTGNEKNVILPDTVNGKLVVFIAAYTFNGKSTITNIVLPANLKSIGADAFDNCSGLQRITIPNSVTNIGVSAFFGCSFLNEIILPNTLKSLEYEIFCQCSALQKIVLPNFLTFIGREAFYSCTAIKDIVLPDSLTSMGANAFNSCSSLTNAVLSTSLTVMSNNAFKLCITLSNMTVYATNPPTIYSATLPGTNVLKHIYVPAASVSAYKSANWWSNYASAITAIP